MKPGLFIKPILLLFIIMNSCSPLQKNTATSNGLPDTFLADLLAKNAPLFDSILAKKDELGVQIIYTQIDRTKRGKPKFTDHYYYVNPDTYFYPASTVKFPIAVLALQKLKELNISGLNMNTTMITGAAGEKQTEVNNDPSAADGRPTIAHYIKKILLVSDNDAFNRLYEFLGQEYINSTLHKMGYTDVQIIHRLSINLTEEENRHTNPVKFIDTAGKVIYEKPAEKSALVYAQRDTKLGKGFMRGDELVQQPFDFSKKNRLALQSLHLMIRSIMFPDAMAKDQRFDLRDDDYNFLRRYMSMVPPESKSPAYSPKEFWSNYIKTIYYGIEKITPEPHIRIFNKTGTAYGFLIDASYFADLKNNIEFMVSAVIYCNSDGIFNDDNYDYEKTGNPFFKNLGRALYDHELKRQRLHKPDLGSFYFDYTK